MRSSRVTRPSPLPGRSACRPGRDGPRNCSARSNPRAGSTAPSNFEVRPGEGGTLTCQAKVMAASPATTASNSLTRVIAAQPADGDVEFDDLADVALDVLERCLVQVGTVRAHRTPRDGRPEAVGESVLDARPDTDVGLDAGDDHPFNTLLLQQEGQVGREKGGKATLVNHNLTWLLLESRVRLLVAVTEVAVFRELRPLVVVKTSTVRFPGVDDQAPAGSSGIEQLVQRTEVLQRTGVVEWPVGVEERPVDVHQYQSEAMAGIAGMSGRH